jgi:replication factor C subunit 1
VSKTSRPGSKFRNLQASPPESSSFHVNIMPADIRSFFGGKSSQGSVSSPTKPPAKKETPARNKRGRKVVNDSDDDDDVVVTDAPVSGAKPSSKS